VLRQRIRTHIAWLRQELADVDDHVRQAIPAPRSRLDDPALNRW